MISAPVSLISAPVGLLKADSAEQGAPVDKSLFDQLPPELQTKIRSIPPRNKDHILLSNLILELCRWSPLKSSDLAKILGRSEKYFIRNFITPLRESGRLEYVYPEMPNHPAQAYKTGK